ncbi:hypothetical protein VIGAN_04276300 [Vigna angularis var. angularis]|uniref:Reverse transcriptase domain-containing protein n=1 Tax=Vigna angularis var. angularis TaxID=157739 RepID=A0A0S3RXD8_PHAAN|nr:hypothetical protein VIGAN_04276300 [Vigna angularis var. angularis]
MWNKCSKTIFENTTSNNRFRTSLLFFKIFIWKGISEFKRCMETNLVLNSKKCHFMVNEDIVLDHKIYGKGIEVNPTKVEAISKLPSLVNVKGIRSF